MGKMNEETSEIRRAGAELTKRKRAVAGYAEDEAIEAMGITLAGTEPIAKLLIGFDLTVEEVADASDVMGNNAVVAALQGQPINLVAGGLYIDGVLTGMTIERLRAKKAARD